MSMSNYLENKILDHTLKNTQYACPATIYLALFTVDPGETGAGTEVSGGSYIREAVTFGAASNGSSTNSADVIFPVATLTWGTVVSVGIFDAATSGNMLYYGSLSASQTVAVNNQLIFKAGQITITLD